MKTKLEYMHVLTQLPISQLEEMFLLKPEQIIAGTEKVRTRKEWSAVLKEVGVDFD